MLTNSIDDFLAFAERYAPGFGQNIEGASTEQIKELQDLCGHPLPTTYREFLAAMGTRDGGLRLGQTATTSVTALIAQYREMRDGFEPWLVPANCVMVATGDPVSLGEMCLKIDGTEERGVFQSVDAQIYCETADSLLKLCFRTIFVRHELNPLPFVRLYNWPGSQHLGSPIASVESALKDSNFESEWFSDSVCVCAKRGVVVAVAYYWPTRRFTPTLRVAGPDEREVEEEGRSLAAILGLEISKSQGLPPR